MKSQALPRSRDRRRAPGPSPGLAVVLVGCLLASVPARAEGPAVAIVTGPGAPALEQVAATELEQTLVSLFGAKVTLTEAPTEAPHRILLGSPATNPAVKAAIGSEWPDDLGEQGHLLKSTPSGLVLGGGSPAATLWAVYELGYRFGIRSTPHGDLPPTDAPEPRFDGFDEVLRPQFEIRAWHCLEPGPAGLESWGLEEQRRLLRQLAKLKFNRVVLRLRPGSPFQDPASTGTPQGEGHLWNGETFAVDGDTAGRSAFAGAAAFENPDFSGAETSEARFAAGRALVAGIVETARELGMEAVYKSAGAGNSGLPTLALGDPNGGLLPYSSVGVLNSRLGELREAGKRGFAIACPLPGGQSYALHHLSRAAFAPGQDPRDSLESLVAPTCGEGVAERVAAAIDALESVSELIAREAPEFAAPDPEMFLKHYRTAAPAPAWWAEAKTLYGTAVNEFYRANTRARGGPRSFLLYHAKTLTFALHYLGAAEAIHEGGLARANGDGEAWVESLETALEALHNSLAAYADVAADPSDRGAIAVLNAYAYRPLLEALEAVPLE